LGLGAKEKPKYAPMHARQILAPPHGFVWRMKSGAISGSDGATPHTSWTRFWLFGFIPVVRVGGHADHHRSAFGRVVAEGTFWTPAALLPDEYVRWEEVNADTARAVVRFGEFEQAVDVTIAANGQPSSVAIQRWSNANTDKKYRLQSFGGYLSEFRDFDGFNLPTRVEGGNLIDTDDYFPFFKARVTSIPGRHGRYSEQPQMRKHEQNEESHARQQQPEICQRTHGFRFLPRTIPAVD